MFQTGSWISRERFAQEKGIIRFGFLIENGESIWRLLPICHNVLIFKS